MQVKKQQLEPDIEQQTGSNQLELKPSQNLAWEKDPLEVPDVRCD